MVIYAFQLRRAYINSKNTLFIAERSFKVKRFLSILLSIFMLTSLCACGGANSVEKALQGKWVSESGNGGIYIFDDGHFSCETVISGLSLGVKEGDYTISDNVIELSYDNGVEGKLEFTYENGELSIDGLVKQ
jgi:hypothetical protein